MNQPWGMNQRQIAQKRCEGSDSLPDFVTFDFNPSDFVSRMFLFGCSAITSSCFTEARTERMYRSQRLHRPKSPPICPGPWIELKYLWRGVSSYVPSRTERL